MRLTKRKKYKMHNRCMYSQIWACAHFFKSLLCWMEFCQQSPQAYLTISLPQTSYHMLLHVGVCLRVRVCVCVRHCVNSELGAFYGLSARLRHFSNGSVLSHWQRYVTWIIIYKDMGKGPVMNTLGFGKSTLTSNCVAVVALIQRNSISFLLHDIIFV